MATGFYRAWKDLLGDFLMESPGCFADMSEFVRGEAAFRIGAGNGEVTGHADRCPQSGDGLAVRKLIHRNFTLSKSGPPPHGGESPEIGLRLRGC